MIGFLLAFHVLVCLLLVTVVLLQAGKGGGLAGAFGGPGGAGQSFFGSRGAGNFLTRATVTLGGLFFVTAIALALLTGNQNLGRQSLIQQEATRQRGAGEVTEPPPTPAVPPANSDQNAPPPSTPQNSPGDGGESSNP